MVPGQEGKRGSGLSYVSHRSLYLFVDADISIQPLSCLFRCLRDNKGEVNGSHGIP